jgi:mannose-6-phosphate isomerase class I
MLDSFVVYIALNGSVRIVADGEVETLDEGEVILIPAEISEITIDSIGGDAKLMEVYIDK